MIKRILLVLDSEPEKRVSTRYAVELARKNKAVITGLAVVNTEEISTESAGGPIGTIYYANELRRHLSEQARREAQELITHFKNYLDQQELEHSEGIEEGVPFKRICEDSKYHDLMVMGHDAEFFTHRSENRHKTLARVVKNGTAPVLITPSEFKDVKYVVAAIDGSRAALRTLQQFAHLLPFGKNIHIDVVHVRNGEKEEDKQESRLFLHLASQYLKDHHFKEVREVSLEVGSVPMKVSEHVDKVNAQLLVLGAHSGSAIHRLAFGSVTDGILEQENRLLFMGH